MTYLCVAIFVTDLAQARRDIALAAESGADMVELRIDTFTDADQLRELVSTAILPVIVTCRPEWEGGNSEATDAERISALETVGAAGATYLDIELATLRRNPPPATDRPLIVSTHDFTSRPAKLGNLLIELNQSPGTINKIVWTARSIRDNLEVFELLKQRHKPTIALCMGEAGMISRILAKKFGAFLTFASLSTGTGTAAGQISVREMKELYRWDAINPRTKVYGVVAQPVMHSMSPAIHNAAFSATNYDGIYLPLLVEGSYESFKAFMETFLDFEGLDLSGLSITIPHKENALRYLQERGGEIEPLAAAIGAVNTIVIDRSTGALRLSGINTDYAAILDSITSALGIERKDLAKHRVAVLGAGGTGRTAVAALAACGAGVLVWNRTSEKAEALAQEFNGRTGQVAATTLTELIQSKCDIYINTTSVGMYPNVDASPIDDPAECFTSDTLVFDTIYNPLKTKLLKQAENRGAKTIAGIEMFVRQAATQFGAWTGKAAPRELMRTVIERKLPK